MYSRTLRMFLGIAGFACCTLSVIVAPTIGLSAQWTNVETNKSITEGQRPQNSNSFNFVQILIIRTKGDLFENKIYFSSEVDKKKPLPLPFSKYPSKLLCSAIIFVRYEQDAVHKPPWNSLVV